MKKLLFLLLFVSLQTIDACNLCTGHDGQRRFRKQNPTFVTCNCDCQAQGISTHEDGHKCVKCGHRVIPYTLEKEPLLSLGGSAVNEWKSKRHLKRFSSHKKTDDQEFLVAEIG